MTATNVSEHHIDEKYGVLRGPFLKADSDVVVADATFPNFPGGEPSRHDMRSVRKLKIQVFAKGVTGQTIDLALFGLHGDGNGDQIVNAVFTSEASTKTFASDGPELRKLDGTWKYCNAINITNVGQFGAAVSKNAGGPGAELHPASLIIDLSIGGWIQVEPHLTVNGTHTEGVAIYIPIE